MAGEFSLGSVQVSAPPLERFREFLEPRGKRITRQRRLIVERSSAIMTTSTPTN